MFGLTTTAKLKEARDAAIKLKAERDNARAARDIALERVEAEKHRAKQFGRLNSELLSERDEARSILREISALETPTCAHIGRKMAAKAREGLPEFATGEPVREVA